MYCPECAGQTTVIESRVRTDGTVYRRRECLDCGLRISTTEAITVKKSEEPETYEDREPAMQQRPTAPKPVRPWGVSDLHIALRARKTMAYADGDAAAKTAK